MRVLENAHKYRAREKYQKGARKPAKAVLQQHRTAGQLAGPRTTSNYSGGCGGASAMNMKHRHKAPIYTYKELRLTSR